MDAQTFHDLNVVARKLSDVLSDARYGDNRSGLVPPEALPQLQADISDALLTMEALQNGPVALRLTSEG